MPSERKLKQLLQQREDDYDDLESKYSKLCDNYNDLLRHTTQIKEVLQEKYDHCNDLQRDVAELKKMLERADNELGRLETKCEFGKLSREVGALISRNLHASQISALQSELTMAKSVSQKQQERLQSELAVAKRWLQKKQERNQQLIDALGRAGAKLNAHRKKLKKQQTQYDKRVKENPDGNATEYIQFLFNGDANEVSDSDINGIQLADDVVHPSEDIQVALNNVSIEPPMDHVPVVMTVKNVDDDVVLVTRDTGITDDITDTDDSVDQCVKASEDEPPTIPIVGTSESGVMLSPLQDAACTAKSSCSQRPTESNRPVKSQESSNIKAKAVERAEEFLRWLDSISSAYPAKYVYKCRRHSCPGMAAMYSDRTVSPYVQRRHSDSTDIYEWQKLNAKDSKCFKSTRFPVDVLFVARTNAAH